MIIFKLIACLWGNQMNKVIITGADGFIGKNLVAKLLLLNIEVYAIVYPTSKVYEGRSEKNLHVFYIDLISLLNQTDNFPKDIDVMFHLAWIGVRPEMRDDLHEQMKNIEVSLNCMTLASLLGIKKVIFPGSTNEFVKSIKPINRESLPSPGNAYGAVKVAIRYLCIDYARKHEINFIYAIISGIYAADRRDNNVIFYTIDCLINKKKPSLTKLEQLVDYVYIDDAIDALLAIGENGKREAVYAIGHGDNWPLIKYIKIIHQKIDASLPLGIGDIPYPSEILPNSCIDLKDLKDDTGFEPKISFEDGISLVINKIRADLIGG